MRLFDYLLPRPKLSRFATRLLAALPADQRAEWVFDSDRGLLKHPDGSQVSLQNMFTEYRASTVFGRGALVRKYAELAQAQSAVIPALWPAAMNNIIPVVRSEFLECTVEIQSRAEGVTRDPVVLPLAGDLRVRLVYDFGNYFTFIRSEHLTTWGKSPARVLEQALANLGRLETPSWTDDGRGVLRLNSPMSYAESMMQLRGVIALLPFADHALVMPCSRGILLAADGRSDAAILTMLNEATRCLQHEPWPMSGCMLRRHGDGWEQVAPPRSAQRLSHSLGQQHLADVYAAQKEALEALHEQAPQELFVATFALHDSDGDWQSYCVWSEDVPTLLPVTDWVAMVPEAEHAAILRVDWSDLVNICGARLRATDEHPARFLVTSFPDPGEWQALSAHSRPRN